jgi:putative transposase
MARPLRIQFPGAHYHITCRGIERRKIFMDNEDRYKFLTYLRDSLATYQVVLYTYVMMSNHFHLLIQTRKANCSEFMRHFNIRYTGWFNWRHERSGNLYQGRYHAYLVDADTYLLAVSRYVHLNPVYTKFLKTMTPHDRWQRVITYPWSSLPGYLNAKRRQDFVNYDTVLSMAGGRRAYRTFLRDGLRPATRNPFKHVRNRIIIGDDGFAASVQRHLRHVSTREQPAYREMIQKTAEPPAVLGFLMQTLKVNKTALAHRGTNGIMRGIVAELLYKYCVTTQAEIGVLLGNIDYMSVYQLRGRLKTKMDHDPGVRKKFTDIETELRKFLSNV